MTPKKRRQLLTSLMLEGMLESLMLTNAGSPADLTGTDDEDPEAIRLYDAARDALGWVQDEIEARAERQKKRFARSIRDATTEARKTKRQNVLTSTRGKR